MRVTIIPPDNKIIVDGKLIKFSSEDWDFDDEHIHAIQWFDDHGEIEWITTDSNEELETIDMVQPYIDLYLSELPKIEKVRIEREEAERKQLQSEIDERVDAEKEKEALLLKIRETAEENRRLGAKTQEKELEKERLKLQIEDKERELEIERELKAKEIEKVKIDAEIALAEEKSRSEILAEKARLEEEDNLMAEKKAELTEMFKTMSDVMGNRRSEFDELVAKEREYLEAQRQEYLRQQKLTQESVEAEQLEVEVRTKELQKTRSELQNELQSQIETQLQERQRIQADHENLIAEFEIEKVKLQNQLLEVQAQKDIIDKELALEQELLEKKDKSVEMERESLAIQQELLTKEKEEFNKLVEVEKDSINAKLYAEKARLEAERLVEERINEEIQLAARQRSSEKIREIAEETDPLLLFEQIESDPDLDITTFPVTKILGWFSQLQKVQDFCIKYNLTYQQIQSSPELKKLCDDYIDEHRGSPGG